MSCRYPTHSIELAYPPSVVKTMLDNTLVNRQRARYDDKDNCYVLNDEHDRIYLAGTNGDQHSMVSISNTNQHMCNVLLCIEDAFSFYHKVVY